MKSWIVKGYFSLHYFVMISNCLKLIFSYYMLVCSSMFFLYFCFRYLLSIQEYNENPQAIILIQKLRFPLYYTFKQIMGGPIYTVNKAWFQFLICSSWSWVYGCITGFETFLLFGESHTLPPLSSSIHLMYKSFQKA